MDTLLNAYSQERVEFIRGWWGMYFKEIEENVNAGKFPFHKSERDSGEFLFYLNASRSVGEIVLELACGAGRMSIALGHAGIRVIGLDASLPMLSYGHKILSLFPEDVQKRVRFVQGDMCNFALRKPVRLIIIPFNSFWYNFYRMGGSPRTHADSCVRCIIDALEFEGRFIVDAPNHNNCGYWWYEMAEKYGFRFVISDDKYFHTVLIGEKTSR